MNLHHAFVEGEEMNNHYQALLQSRMNRESYEKLAALNNPKVMSFVGFFVDHCRPESVYVCDDSEHDIRHVRSRALETGEETALAKAGQTIHWDNYGDQARDRQNTRIMVPGEKLESMSALNAIDLKDGYKEIQKIAKGIMEGKEAIIQFFSEGPTESPFTVPCIQFTDSWYVAHSEYILYRSAYHHFLKMKDSEKDDFFCFLHSAGALDERGNSLNLDQRRIYMDTHNNIVYSLNCQYAGNSVGLKKQAMRLAINKAGREGWLCEHMFVMAAIDEEKNRRTYFCGAYPSACGKTSTAMIPGEKIVGDDIAYFRNIDGAFRAVNVEFGMFGIIKDVNEEDDPVIFENLMKEQELLFTNVLMGPDRHPYWLGMGVDTPEKGRNHFGIWQKGAVDDKGAEVRIAHGNARYTMRLDYLKNIDKEGFESKSGVQVEGILYGGRDSDITVPVEESPSWRDGILLKAATLESETTSATLGKEGVRKSDPMAITDFLSYPLGQYTMNNIRFGEQVDQAPRIFSTNYFMKSAAGNFMTGKLAKKVWLHWAEGRLYGEYDAYDTPTGKIPRYEDLAALFQKHLKEVFTKEDYEYLFSFRCAGWIGKLERTKAFYTKMDPHTPQELFDYWDQAIEHIRAAKERFGDVILPGVYRP
jgi:phosphoenolpyruvate carboxykinase (GTP)